jgi:hypothetical protein
MTLKAHTETSGAGVQGTTRCSILWLDQHDAEIIHERS